MLYDFAFEPETALSLKDYNFNIFTLVNNYLVNQGQRGIKETYQNLNDLCFYHFGSRDSYLLPSYSDNNNLVLSEENCLMIITETRSRKIAWPSFSIVYQVINEEKIVEMIKIAKDESNFVIVSPHWGVES